MQKILKQNKYQSLTLQVEVLDFQYIAPFESKIMSNATGVGLSTIRNFSGLSRITGAFQKNGDQPFRTVQCLEKVKSLLPFVVLLTLFNYSIQAKNIILSSKIQK